jgi:hypothetical protein
MLGLLAVLEIAGRQLNDEYLKTTNGVILIEGEEWLA